MAYFKRLLLLVASAIIYSHRKHKHYRKSFILPLSFQFNHIKITGGIQMVSLKYTQQLRGVLGSPVDAKGNDASIQAGSVKLSSSDEEIFTVEKDETKPDDQAAFKIVAHKPGVAQLDYEADADLGEGVKTIAGFAGVEVLPGEAVGFGQPSFGTPEEQPAGETGPAPEPGPAPTPEPAPNPEPGTGGGEGNQPNP